MNMSRNFKFIVVSLATASALSIAACGRHTPPGLAKKLDGSKAAPSASQTVQEKSPNLDLTFDVIHMPRPENRYEVSIRLTPLTEADQKNFISTENVLAHTTLSTQSETQVHIDGNTIDEQVSAIRKIDPNYSGAKIQIMIFAGVVTETPGIIASVVNLIHVQEFDVKELQKTADADGNVKSQPLSFKLSESSSVKDTRPARAGTPEHTLVDFHFSAQKVAEQKAPTQASTESSKENQDPKAAAQSPSEPIQLETIEVPAKK